MQLRKFHESRSSRRESAHLCSPEKLEPTHVGCYVFVASGVSRIIILRRACEKPRIIREFEPTHVGCYEVFGPKVWVNRVSD